MDYLVPLLFGELFSGLSVPHVLFTVVTLLVLYNWPVWDRHILPPGPWPLPFVGNTLWMAAAADLSKEIYGLRKFYGDVITLHLPRGAKWIVLNSPEAIQEGFVKHAEFLSEFHSTIVGAIHEDNEPQGLWKEKNKRVLKVVRDPVIGGKGMDTAISDEISHFVEAVEAADGAPIDLIQLLPKVTANIVTTMLLGTRFDYSDRTLLDLQFGKFAGLNMKSRFVPLIKHGKSYHEAKDQANKGIEFVEEKIRQRRRDLDQGNLSNDYINSFLMDYPEQNSDRKQSDRMLLRHVTGFYLAGTDTTSHNLYWNILYLLLNPDVTDKMYSEIQNKIGTRPVRYSDKDMMPYTSAVMTELLRVTLVASLSIEHEAMEDVMVCGVKIPKGSRVVANLHSTCHNPTVYPDPEVFNPERFLDAEGNFLKPEQMYMTPFGAGRRQCVCKHLAKSEQFMLLVTIIQKFKLELGQTETPSLKGSVKHLVKAPEKNYLVKLTNR